MTSHAPVIVHISNRQQQGGAEPRYQELENQYLDDGWACYDVPPADPMSEMMVFVFMSIIASLCFGAVIWLVWSDWKQRQEFRRLLVGSIKSRGRD